MSRAREVLEGKVRGLTSDAEAVVETARGLVFAAGALPGEEVRVGELRREGKVLRAHRLEIVRASSGRVMPRCEWADLCGGCPLMLASHEAQIALKREQIERALARVPRSSDAPSIVMHPATATFAYRSRARLAWKVVGGRAVLGMLSRRSERIVEIDRCVVLRPELAGALEWMRTALAPLLDGRGELHLGLGPDARPVLALSTDDAQRPALYGAIEQAVGPVLVGASLAIAGAGPSRLGAAFEVSSDIEGRALESAIGGFSQAHREMNAELGRIVMELAMVQGARALELYAGSGNFTLALASRASALRAVELDPAAVSALRENLRRHGLSGRVEVIAGDAGASARGSRRDRSFDVVVLDPPRTGARDAIAAIVSARPARVVYVSCDPRTLGRDLELLGEAGYATDAVHGLDMFPHTAHVEVVARARPVTRDG